MKLKFIAAASLVALSATGAQALSISTFSGGAHGSFQTAIETPIAGSFFKEYDFTLSGTNSLTATFASSNIVGSFGLYKADDTPLYSWGVGGTSFSTSSTFTLGAGSYYYAVLGKGKPGSYTLTSTAVAAAVPEPETYALLAAGLGVIGFVASRRRRDS